MRSNALPDIVPQNTTFPARVESIRALLYSLRWPAAPSLLRHRGNEMIDYRELKTRRDEIAKNIADRNMKVDVDEAIRLQDRRAELMKIAEELRAARNLNASKMKGKMDNDARQALIAEGREIKDRIAATESELEVIDKDFNTIIRQIPNYAHPSAPVGKEDKDNTAILPNYHTY